MAKRKANGWDVSPFVTGLLHGQPPRTDNDLTPPPAAVEEARRIVEKWGPDALAPPEYVRKCVNDLRKAGINEDLAGIIRAAYQIGQCWAIWAKDHLLGEGNVLVKEQRRLDNLGRKRKDLATRMNARAHALRDEFMREDPEEKEKCRNERIAERLTREFLGELPKDKEGKRKPVKAETVREYFKSRYGGG